MQGQVFGGRSDPLFKGNNSNANTGSTATSDPAFTQRSSTRPNKSTMQLPLEEIVQEKEILETSIDPQEWKKECERVKNQLMLKLTDGAIGKFETEAEEINSRRIKMLENIKVVREFSQSNVPLLMETMCEEWQSQLLTIRQKES